MTPTNTPDFYPTGATINFSSVLYAAAFGRASVLLLESAHGRLPLRPGEHNARLGELIRTGNELLAARCGSVVYNFMESLLLGFNEDNTAARDLRAAIPAVWHQLYSDNAAHVAALRGYRG